MRLFYDPHIDPTAREHQLNEEESKHIIRVLRLKNEDQIGILDGNGRIFKTHIIDAHPKRCLLFIDQIEQEDAPNYSIHIAVAPTKQMERIEWFIEKATEIGITAITIIDCKNGERSKINMDRLQKKAISAMKQSHRTFLPEIHSPVPVIDFIKNNPNGLVAHCYEEHKNSFESVYQFINCPILIGPEGDFTKDEIETALQNGYKTITLGENRLRTETAALYACMRAKLMTE